MWIHAPWTIALSQQLLRRVLRKIKKIEWVRIIKRGHQNDQMKHVTSYWLRALHPAFSIDFLIICRIPIYKSIATWNRIIISSSWPFRSVSIWLVIAITSSEISNHCPSKRLRTGAASKKATITRIFCAYRYLLALHFFFAAQNKLQGITIPIPPLPCPYESNHVLHFSLQQPRQFFRAFVQPYLQKLPSLLYIWNTINVITWFYCLLGKTYSFVRIWLQV